MRQQGLMDGWRAETPLSSFPAALTVAGWTVGLVTTATVVGTPYLLFAYFSPDLHLVLDSIDTCVALLLAYLLFGRFKRSRRLPDLLLAEGLLVLGMAGVGMTMGLRLLQGSDETAEVWLPVVLRILGAALILVASVTPSRLVPAAGQRSVKALPWAVAAVGIAATWVVQDSLPPALAQSPPLSAEHVVVAGHPLLLGAHALTAACFAVASVRFTLTASRRHNSDDQLLLWLGPACGLAAFARVNYVLFPSLYSDWVYTGDLLRTGSYLLLLIGATREIGRYWSAQARTAVLDDRRRLARELHDGVVQELTYIRSEAHTAASDPSASQRIIDACDRALDEARAAVDALGRSSDEPLGFVLHRAARQVTERYHAGLEVELDDGVSANDDQRHALVRITREAVSNAIRHGRAQRVQLRLASDEHGRQLLVRDDGSGFDLSLRAQATGYGLTSMEERARALHGSFSIESAPGQGTTVAVTW